MAFGKFLILVFGIFAIANSAFAQQARPTPIPPPRQGELKCDVAMQRLLQASDYGTSLGGLKPHVKMQSFKVADVKHGMKVATDAIAKLPKTTPEEQKLIDQANLQRAPLDKAEEEFSAAYFELEALQLFRQKVEALITRDGNFSVTLGDLEKKIAVATAKSAAAEAAIESKRKEYFEFLEKNNLVHVVTASNYQLESKANLKKSMLAAVRLGDVADASRRIDYIEKTIGRAGLPIPFDEIVVIRGLSMEERKKISDQYRESLPDAEEIAKLELNRLELADVLASKTRSPDSTPEIQRMIEKTEQRLKKLAEKNPREVIDQLKAKLATERPVTVLKSNGAIIGAISDGEFQSVNMQPWDYGSRGFWCRDTKTVDGGWSHHLGMMSLEMCDRASKYQSKFYIDEGLCSDAMDFYYPHVGRNAPVPTKSPAKAKGTAR